MRPQKKCKLCSLFQEDKELWEQVHQMVLSEGVSHTLVIRWVNAKIAAKKAENPECKLTRFNSQNFSSHFNTHLSESDALLKQLRNEIVDLENRGDSSYTPEQIIEADAKIEEYSGVEEHKELEQMISICRKAITEMGPTLRTSSVKAIADYQDLVSTLLTLKKELSALKTQDRIAKAAVDAAIHYIVVHVINKTTLAAERISDLLRQALPGSTIPGQVVSLLHKDIGDALKEISPQVKDMVREEFGIK